ncbi:TonB-dependent receptor [Brevundimonas sp. S30B]|uniref:TonB-dependent receptor n=1 Tax=unclassified Brevundimonas TaxID=2622653 RepID=UPI0010728526|nr:MULTISPECIES: TonB-dependent receptor [unclassified Brevundimonas]QBX37695.1 TonB-dependent receptor [Brevundimonas sp. MF30-B]TFW00559.1 TonB-dependent receptor [Brevundimonas sp. S30B]
MVRYRNALLLGCATVALTATMAAAQAQPQVAQPVQAAAEQEATTQVGDIVVTAERRQQNLQDYAGVAQSITGETLRAVGIDQIEDLQSAVPGLSISNQEGNVQIYIRGVGTANNTELGDPSAATHLNGVYLPRPRGLGGMFFDLARVEIAKGPQGTLRGRNAVAGTLNIIPNMPRLGSREGFVQGEVGTLDTTGFEAAVNLPIGDTQAVRLAVYGMDKGTAYENVGNDSSLKPTGIQELFSARATYLYEPNDRFRVTLMGDYASERGTGYPATNIRNGLVNGGTPDQLELREVLFRGPQGLVENDNWGLALNASYDLGAVVLEYIASRRSVDYYQVNAANEGVVRPGYGAADVDYDNFGTQYWLTLSKSDIHELRLSSSPDSRAVWSTGLFYFKEDQEVGFLSVVDKGLFYSGTEFTFPEVKSESFAAYFDVTYPVTDQLRVKGGFRYTDESKSRRGVGGNWSLGLGSEGFGCCFTTRLGTEGFRPIFRGRASYEAPAPGDKAAAAQYFLGAFRPGARDTFLEQIAGVADGSRPNGTCVDRPDTQPDYGGQVCPANGQHSFFEISAPGEQVGSYEDSFSDYRVGFEYDFTSDNLFYGAISTGHKSGGFNDTITINGVQTAPTFAPEAVTLYELGTKNTFRLDTGRIDVNANVFYYDYSDQVFQTLVSLGVGPGGSSAGFSQQNINVAQSTIKGFELETRFDLPWGMRLDLIGAYIDAKADSGALTDTRGTDYGDGTPNFNIDIAGNDLPNVSKVNLNAHLQKTTELMGGRADFHLLANYRSSYQLNIYNELPVIQFVDRPTDPAAQAAYDAFKASVAGTTINPTAPLASPFLRSTDARDGGFWARQGGYVTVNLGAGWEPASGRYRVEAYVNNLFDKTVVEKQLVSDEVVNVLFLNQPRTMGVRLRANF